MSVREVFGCFGCRQPGGTDEPHRDFDLKPFGVGYVHERCRVPDDHLDDRPLCTRSDAEHYPSGGMISRVADFEGAL